MPQFARRLAKALRFRVALILDRPNLPIDLHGRNILLSRCTLVLRCASFLTDRANDLPMHMLDAPHADTTWLPDREVPKRAARSLS